MKKRWKIVIGLIILLPIVAWISDKIWPLPLNEVQMAKIVVAEDGTPLWRFADAEGVWRYPVELKDVSPYYLDALITYEDRFFYQHQGINIISIGRAILQNITSQRIVSGGSTLSMQVARLIEPHNRTFIGKLRQVWRTLQLEWHLSKNEILTLYLNRAPFGGTLQGIGAASWTYLGKPPAEITRSEAALMAVLPQAPSRLRPDRHPERSQQARDKVLRRMAEYNVWSEELVKEALEESVWLAPRKVPQNAPLLARRLANNNRIENLNEDVIKTNIDLVLQRNIEEMALNWKGQLGEKTSLAVLIVEHNNMAVRAYVGSADFNDTPRFGHVDMIASWRSPGSTLKPFIYAMAIDEGLIHSESLLQDVPRQFSDYRPGNFDTGFSGPVSASEALQRSLNLPSVQLLEAYGPKRFAAALRNVGVELKFPLNTEPNLSLILGGTGMRLDQLVSAYSAFARQGNVALLRFKEDAPLAERKLLSAESAWIVRQILAGESRPRPNHLRSEIVPLAWKTGTSYGYRDAWAIGVNSNYLIGVWVGRPDATPVVGQHGFSTAIPFLYQIDNVLETRISRKNQRLKADPKPRSVDAEAICWPQGQPLPANDPNCRQRRYAWTIDGITPPTLAAPRQESIFGGWLTWWKNEQGKRVASDCPNAQMVRTALWPITLASWLPKSEALGVRVAANDTTCPPMGYDAAAPLLIAGIAKDSILRRLPSNSVMMLRITAQGGVGKRWWFLNGKLIGENAFNEILVYEVSIADKYQLVVMDEGGQVDKIQFIIE